MGSGIRGAAWLPILQVQSYCRLMLSPGIWDGILICRKHYVYIYMYLYVPNKIPASPDKWYVPHNNSLLLISLTDNVKKNYLHFHIRFIFIVNHCTTDGCTQHQLHEEENGKSCITTSSNNNAQNKHRNCY